MGESIKKIILWIPEALLTVWLLPLQGSPILPFTLLMLIPFFLSIVLSSCLKLNVNHNGNSCFLHCKPKFKEKVWCVCVNDTHMYVVYAHITCVRAWFSVWVYARREHWCPDLSLSSLFLWASLPLTLELGWQTSPACPPQRWCYNHACAMPRFLYVDDGI